MPRGRQALIYSMALDVRQDVAMILPIPVADGSGEDAVRFVNLEKYPEVFADLSLTFAPVMPLGVFGIAGSRSDSVKSEVLKVRQVGAFNASFVPGVKDFGRLDAQFRLPDGVWDKLGDYSRYGFAVFKLRKGLSEVHPMALTFPTALPGKLFFPTVHIHDGKVHDRASFDHTLYAQTPNGKAPALHDWSESERLARSEVKTIRAQGLISGFAHVFRRTMKGRLRNADVIA